EGGARGLVAGSRNRFIQRLQSKGNLSLPKLDAAKVRAGCQEGRLQGNRLAQIARCGIERAKLAIFRSAAPEQFRRLALFSHASCEQIHDVFRTVMTRCPKWQASRQQEERPAAPPAGRQIANCRS